MSGSRTIVFVCLHGAAKSVVAANYLNRLAAARGMNVRAEAAGLEPEPAVAPAVSAALCADGIDVGDYRPRLATPSVFEQTWRIVAFDCDVGDVAPAGVPVTQWTGVPALSDNFEVARGVIVDRVSRLLDECEDVA